MRLRDSLLVGAVLAIPSPVLADDSLKLLLGPEKQVLRSGEQVTLDVTITNPVSGGQIIVPENNARDHAEFDVKIRIHDENGSIPAFTSYGNSVFGDNGDLSVSYHRHFLDPGQSASDTLALNSIYDLKDGHTYSLSISKEVRSGDHAVELRSNWATVVVR